MNQTKIEKLETAIRSELPELMVSEKLIIVEGDIWFQESNIPQGVTLLHLLRYLMTTGTIRLVSVSDVMLLMVGETKININLSKPLLRDQPEYAINELVKLLK
jgi:hypothetical protein